VSVGNATPPATIFVEGRFMEEPRSAPSEVVHKAVTLTVALNCVV
jgi:hypothetical protein